MATQAAAAGINAVTSIPMAIASPVVTKAVTDPFTALCCTPCSDFTVCGYVPSSWQEGVLLIAAALNVAVFALAFFAGYYALATAAGVTAVVLVFAASIASQLVALESLQATAKELEATKKTLTERVGDLSCHLTTMRETNGQLTAKVTDLTKVKEDLTAQILLLNTLDASLAAKLEEYNKLNASHKELNTDHQELLRRQALEQGKLEATTKSLQSQEALAKKATEQADAATQACKDAAILNKYAAAQNAQAAAQVNKTVADIGLTINPPGTARSSEGVVDTHTSALGTNEGQTPVEVNA